MTLPSLATTALPHSAKKRAELAAVLGVTFIESFGTILLERGLYFYTHALFGFSRAENLGVAFSFGVFYVIGALLSHPLTARFGERRVLAWSLGVLLATHLGIFAFPTSTVIVSAFPLVALLQGLKWPVMETFVSAGRAPREMFKLVGFFNVSWAASVPLGLAASGPLIASAYPRALFLLAALINLTALLALGFFSKRPEHLAVDDPMRPELSVLEHFKKLLVSSRWSMLASYSLLFLLAPLMPAVFSRLGLTVASSTLAASWLDVVRVLTFAGLGWWAGWHGKPFLLVGVILALPIGFWLSLFAPELWVAIVGETIFGVASALTYYSALFYALVVKNAAVDAGGAHEGLIGLGFAVGPLIGLISIWVEPWLRDPQLSMAAVVGPFVLLCSTAAFLPLLRLARHGSGSPAPARHEP